MDLVVMVIVFGLFGLGFVLAFQGFIGKEINAEGQPFGCRSTSTGPDVSSSGTSPAAAVRHRPRSDGARRRNRNRRFVARVAGSWWPSDGDGLSGSLSRGWIKASASNSYSLVTIARASLRRPDRGGSADNSGGSGAGGRDDNGPIDAQTGTQRPTVGRWRSFRLQRPRRTWEPMDDWRISAACRGSDPALFYPHAVSLARASRPCAVRPSARCTPSAWRRR